MKLAIVTAVILLALAMPFVTAQEYNEWERSCIGNVLVMNKTIIVDSDAIPITQNITCSHGCDAGRKLCIDYSGKPGTAVPGEIFLVLEVLAIILLLAAFIDNESDRKTIFSLIAMIIFFILGMLSFNVIFDGMAMQIDWLGWLNWSLGALCIAIFLYGVLLMFKSGTEGTGV